MSKLYKFTNVNDEKRKISHLMDDIFKVYEDVENNVDEQNIDYQKVGNDSNEIEINEYEINMRRLIKDAKEEASKIIQLAKNQANEIIEEEKININKWWDDKRIEDNKILEDIKNIGYKDGFSEGKVAAEIEIKEEFQSIIKQSRKILESAYEIKEQIIQEAEAVIIEISIGIAEKIIIKESEIDKNIIELITKEALKNIKEFDNISIYVNPENYPFIQAAKGDLVSGLNGQVELMIYPDASIISGGCLIKTSTGTLDAMIDTQLAEIRQALLNINEMVTK